MVLALDSVLYPDSDSALDLASDLDSVLTGLAWVSAVAEDWSVPKVCYSAAGCTDDSADDSSAGDSANCRRNRDGCCNTPDADDTKGAGDDKDFPILPRRSDCNKPVAIPNSIPNRPSPMADYWRSARQSRFPLRK